MSQPELTRALRAARPVAPDELRERVRLVAAHAAPPPRRLLTWRRALVVALPIAAAVAAGVLVTRPSHRAARPAPLPYEKAAATAQPSHAAAQGRAVAPLQPPSSAKRLQRYSASLQLRVPSTAAIPNAAKQAVAIANGLGGYAAYVSVNAGGKSGYAEIRLRVPKTHVQEAIRALSALGQIVGENVQVEDVQAGVNATDRLIARLQRNLAALRAQESTPAVERRILALTARIQQLQRGRAAAVRDARYATIELTLSTPQPRAPAPHSPGPFHGLAAAFRWIGIGLVYALAIAAPFAIVGALAWLGLRALRRRREDALLSRP
jgi:hypothetical protein